MNPCEMNALITAITNQLYTQLSPRDFNYLTVLLSELSKSMYSIAILRGICEWDVHRPPHHRDHRDGKEKEDEDKDDRD